VSTEPHYNREARSNRPVQDGADGFGREVAYPEAGPARGEDQVHALGAIGVAPSCDDALDSA
jgi:hypothetical protein